MEIKISRQVHDASGQIFYDGNRLYAIAHIASSEYTGFHVLHLYLDKTFKDPLGRMSSFLRIKSAPLATRYSTNPHVSDGSSASFGNFAVIMMGAGLTSSALVLTAGDSRER